MTDQVKPMDREAWEARLKEIEVRVEAATPGPWVKDGNGTGGHIKSMPEPPVLDARGWEKTPTVCIYDIWSRLGVPVPESEELASREDKDGKFIAHSRQDIPDLVAYARALQSQLTKALAEVERLMGIAQVASRYVQAERDALSAQEHGLPRQDVEDLEVNMDVAWGNICVAVDDFNAIEKAKQPK